jgi:glutathione S-transferase
LNGVYLRGTGHFMIVYQMPHSPFCIPITAALTSLNVPFETRDVPNWDRGEVIRLTAGEYYQVPLLVDNDRLVFETSAHSQDVARYVDTLYADGRLFPGSIEGPQECVLDFLENEVEARGFKLADIHFIPSITDLVARTMTIRHKERRFGRGCVNQWKEQASVLRAEIDRLLSRFEDTLRLRPFLFGDEPVYADFLLFGVIGNFCWNDWNTLHETQRGMREFLQRVREYRYQ